MLADEYLIDIRLNIWSPICDFILDSSLPTSTFLPSTSAFQTPTFPPYFKLVELVDLEFNLLVVY